MTDGHLGGLLTEKQAHHGTGMELTKGGQPRATMDMLPDVALLIIFDFYLDEARKNTWHLGKACADAWHPLVHVCRKWRIVAFGSPRRLNLLLHCTASTPVRETLDAWPPLLIVVQGNGHELWGVDNIVAALEHNDRVYAIDLRRYPQTRMLEMVLATMQGSFPELTRLDVENTVSVDPASFSAGSAPRLQQLRLTNVQFPGLSNFLLSATHLVILLLWEIPYLGYISPEAMATCLSVLTRLENLHLKFTSPRSRPDPKGQLSPPQPRALLPVLTCLEFRGAGEYFEDLVARVDAPLLDGLYITFFHRPTFKSSQLTQFISRTPKMKVCDEAGVVFPNRDVRVIDLQTSGGELYMEMMPATAAD